MYQFRIHGKPPRFILLIACNFECKKTVFTIRRDRARAPLMVLVLRYRVKNGTRLHGSISHDLVTALYWIVCPLYQVRGMGFSDRRA